MMAIRLPPRWQRAATRANATELQSLLMREHRIAAAIMPIEGALWARISAQVYNAAADTSACSSSGCAGPASQPSRRSS